MLKLWMACELNVQILISILFNACSLNLFFYQIHLKCATSQKSHASDHVIGMNVTINKLIENYTSDTDDKYAYHASNKKEFKINNNRPFTTFICFLHKILWIFVFVCNTMFDKMKLEKFLNPNLTWVIKLLKIHKYFFNSFTCYISTDHRINTSYCCR